MKDLLIFIIAGAVVVGSLLFMPWAELGFGLEPDKCPIWAQGIIQSDLYQGMKKNGEDVYAHLTKAIKSEDKKEGSSEAMTPLIAGNYTYVLAMGLLMTCAAVGIILIGKEDDIADEKTIIPVKK
jgi:hypothetical protein